MVSTDLILRSLFTANYRLAKVVSVKFAVRPRLWAVLYETTKQAVNLSVHQDVGRPSTRIPQIVESRVSVAEI
jgi:hypothetical protein